MKPGYKTTEFWISALVIVGVVCTQVSSLNVFPPRYAALAASIAAAAYAISRGLAKKGSVG